MGWMQVRILPREPIVRETAYFYSLSNYPIYRTSSPLVPPEMEGRGGGIKQETLGYHPLGCCLVIGRSRQGSPPAGRLHPWPSASRKFDSGVKRWVIPAKGTYQTVSWPAELLNPDQARSSTEE